MKDLKLKNDTNIEVEYILKQKEEELAKLGTKQDEQLNKLTEKVLVKQGESLLCMFSKLLSANSCTHSDLFPNGRPLYFKGATYALRLEWCVFLAYAILFLVVDITYLDIPLVNSYISAYYLSLKLSRISQLKTSILSCACCSLHPPFGDVISIILPHFLVDKIRVC